MTHDLNVTSSRPRPLRDPIRVAPLSLGLERFTTEDMRVCALNVRTLGDGALSRQEAAQRIVNFLYESLVVESASEPPGSGPGCALVRCFQTTHYAVLPPTYAKAARASLGDAEPSADANCLALLATRGVKPEWNQVVQSAGHMAIPLLTVEAVRSAPMISRLLEQFGLTAERVVAPPVPELLLDGVARSFNVFHVQDAANSPYIPAQEEFVRQYGVRSVVGMGGSLPDGELFVVMLFCKVQLTPEVAVLFRSLALDVKLALLTATAESLFA